LISHIYHLGLIEAVAKTQRECFEAGVRLAPAEGIVPPPQPTPPPPPPLQEGVRCKEARAAKKNLTPLCGAGPLHPAPHRAYLAGELTDHELTDSDIAEYIEALPQVPAGA